MNVKQYLNQPWSILAVNVLKEPQNMLLFNTREQVSQKHVKSYVPDCVSAYEYYVNHEVSITNTKNVCLFSESRKETGLTSLNIDGMKHYYLIREVILFLADKCHTKH